jgi:hypothetical protein
MARGVRGRAHPKRSEKMVRINIHPHVDVFRKGELVEQRFQLAGKLKHSFCPEKDLKPEEAFCPFQRCGYWRMKHNQIRIKDLAQAQMYSFGRELCSALML